MMSHLEQLQQTISELETQSKQLHSLTEVYERAEKIEEKYSQNLQLLETLRTKLESYERLLDDKINVIAQQNTDAVSLVEQTVHHIEQAETQIKHTRAELEEQAHQIASHLKEIKTQNKTFFEQTQDLLVQKTDKLNAQHERFYTETTERIQNRLQALTKKNEDFYTITATLLEKQLSALGAATNAYYEKSSESMRVALADFKSFAEERDNELETTLLQKIDVIQEENKSLYLQGNELVEKLERSHQQLRLALDSLSEFQMQFDSLESIWASQQKQFILQAQQLQQAQDEFVQAHQQRWEVQTDYQKKALKYIYDNQRKEFNKLNTQIENNIDSHQKAQTSLAKSWQDQFVKVAQQQEQAIEEVKAKLNLQQVQLNTHKKLQTVLLLSTIAMMVMLLVILFR